MPSPLESEYSATFLTGVGLEQRRRRPKRKPHLALEEPPAPEYGDILRNALTLDKPMGSLDDLRKLIQRTRSKLDRQRKVLDGFRTDVRQLKSSSFGPSESVATTPFKNQQTLRGQSSTPSLPNAPSTFSLPNASSAPGIMDCEYPKQPRLQRSQSAGSIRSAPGMVSRRMVQRSESYADLTDGMEIAKMIGVDHLFRGGGKAASRPSSSGGMPKRPPDFMLQQETSLRPASRGGSISNSRRLMSEK
eukprot:gnl/MRDRNA2_/MRDRNA2_88812_c0_seq1.p1 gnl/MRDRNA2_/MRDRNA2_88812_c0~~gnl/MRDRNA2_/MRDRNA2_88812_c0_seq1.p1  ORF type:complete len:276 (+),score=44.15 gnl/MRDRNA2_/MRDRNA2_88812_c0_seq1:88-828(+)